MSKFTYFKLVQFLYVNYCAIKSFKTIKMKYRNHLRSHNFILLYVFAYLLAAFKFEQL